MSESVNPIFNLYNEFNKIISSVVIKYNYRAEESETLQSKSNADRFLDAYYSKDSFSSYMDYSKKDLSQLRNEIDQPVFNSALYKDENTNEYHFVDESEDKRADEYLANDYEDMPAKIKELLVPIKRARVVSEYEEFNDYYRILNGKPPLGTNTADFCYPPERFQKKYNLFYNETITVNGSQLQSDETVVGRVPIPIHEIEDLKGIEFVEILRANGVIDTLIEENPDKEYLHYLGDERISIPLARTAKNFDIIRLNEIGVRVSVLDEFRRIYDQSRRYFMSTIYNSYYRTFIDFYDAFIGLCIMVMTIQQVVMHQLPRSIDREFFDKNGVKLLYEAYGVPYNLSIDEYTQKGIIQYLNMLIQNKSTNKVIFDICGLLGFNNIELYKYYLAKVRKFDSQGVPIIAKKDVFNNNTGEYDRDVYDYEKMYDVYFHKVNLKDTDYTKTITDPTKKVSYETITEGDPYWYEDTNLKKEVWESKYNFVESKYLGMGLSYSMTEIMFENIILFRLLMDTREELSSIKFTIPKIVTGVEITLFEAIVILCCLISKRHGIGGEIITVPSQVISVLDYLRNKDVVTNDTVDTLQFNFNYFKDYLDDAEYLSKERIKDVLNHIDYELIDQYTGTRFDAAGVEITPAYIADLIYLFIDKYGMDNIDLETILINNAIIPYGVKQLECDKIIDILFKDPLKKYGDKERIAVMEIDIRDALKKNRVDITPYIDTIVHDILFTAVLTYMGNRKCDRGEEMSYLKFKENIRSILFRPEYCLDIDTIDAVTEIVEPDFMKGYDLIDRLCNSLSKEDAEKLRSYISVLTIPDSTNKDKIDAINNMYQNIKKLSKFINLKLSDAPNRKVYLMLKRLYDTAFYSKEVKDIFLINKDKESKRVAFNFFEYLYYSNPAIYSALFTTNINAQYADFLDKINTQYNEIYDDYTVYQKTFERSLKITEWFDMIYTASYKDYISNMTEARRASVIARHPDIKDVDNEYTLRLYKDDLFENKVDLPDYNISYTRANGRTINFNKPIKYKDWLLLYLRWSSYTYYNEVFNTIEYTNVVDSEDLPITSPKDYTIECFDCDVERGYEKIKYDTMKDVNADGTEMENLIYFYTNHIISRLEEYIDDLKFVYLTNDTSTPLSDLLVKLIRFFKSFSVDMLNLDLIFVFDLKEENMLRLFDEIAYIQKTIEGDDHLHVTYSDVIHAIQVGMMVMDGDESFENFDLKDAVILRAFYKVHSDIIFRDDFAMSSTLTIEEKGLRSEKIYNMIKQSYELNGLESDIDKITDTRSGLGFREVISIKETDPTE